MTTARDNETHTHLIPHHQRIISSKQWIIEKNNKDPVVKPSSSNKVETTATSTSTTKTKSKIKTVGSSTMKNHITIKPKVASPSTTSSDKESKKKVKEMENTKLQLEYNTVKQENDKLKNVINKLKQEIDIYTNLLNDTNRRDHADHNNKYENHPLMNSLLINTSKRRKLKSDLTTSTSKRKTKEVNGERKQVIHQTSSKDVNPSAEKANQDEMVSPDDIMLMNTLTDVLAHME